MHPSRGRCPQSANVVETLESRTYFAVDLADSISFVAPASKQVKPGQTAAVSVQVTNIGTTAADGPLAIGLSFSPNADGSSPADSFTFNKSIHLAPGSHAAFRLSSKIPISLTPGVYFATANVDPNNTFSEVSLTNNAATTANALTVLSPFPNLLGSWTGTFKTTKGAGKGHGGAEQWFFTNENHTTGGISGSGLNTLSTGAVPLIGFTGTVGTKGALIATAFDSPADGFGEFHFKVKRVGKTLKGTFKSAISSGVITLKLQG